MNQLARSLARLALTAVALASSTGGMAACGGSSDAGDLSSGTGASGAGAGGAPAGKGGASAGKGGGTAGIGAAGIAGAAGTGGSAGVAGASAGQAGASGVAGAAGAAGVAGVAGGGGAGKGQAGASGAGTSQGGAAGAGGTPGGASGGAGKASGGAGAAGASGAAGTSGSAGAGGQCGGCGTTTCGYDTTGASCGLCASDGGCFSGKCVQAASCPGTPCVDATGSAICEGGKGLVASPSGLEICSCTGGGAAAWASCAPLCGAGTGPQNPLVRIFHPGDGEARLPNKPIPFVGVARDPQDGKLGGASMVWTSSLIVAPIGTGESFSAALPVGVHLITLSATDAQGNTGIDSLTLKIDDQSPSVVINHPGNNEVRPAGVPILFSGAATDPQQGSLTGSSLVWTTDQLGAPFGTGQSLMAPLTAGIHVITLTATDQDGNTGYSSLKLFIQ